jgi:hypothetical protein
LNIVGVIVHLRTNIVDGLKNDVDGGIGIDKAFLRSLG